MAHKQVLVQIDDELVEELDALARRLGTNRSELLRRGAMTILHADEMLAADRALVEAYARQPPDLDLMEATSRIAARTLPEW